MVAWLFDDGSRGCGKINPIDVFSAVQRTGRGTGAKGILHSKLRVLLDEMRRFFEICKYKVNSMSLSGGYLPIEKTTESLVPEGTAPGFQPLNRFHRALLCWSFQNALLENEHIARAIQEINPTFAELYKMWEDGF